MKDKKGTSSGHLQIIDSGFTAKSGLGTPMYSRPGKSTIDSYKCFQVDPVEQLKIRHEMKLKLLFGYVRTEEQNEEEEERRFVQAFINEYQNGGKGENADWTPGMEIEMLVNKDMLREEPHPQPKQPTHHAPNEPLKPDDHHKIHFKKHCRFPFRSTDREARSYHDLLPKDTPTVNRYNPNFMKAHPAFDPAYSINPETVNADVRQPVIQRKQCLDDEEVCSLERRVQLRQQVEQERKQRKKQQQQRAAAYGRQQTNPRAFTGGNVSPNNARESQSIASGDASPGNGAMRRSTVSFNIQPKVMNQQSSTNVMGNMRKSYASSAWVTSNGTLSESSPTHKGPQVIFQPIVVDRYPQTDVRANVNLEAQVPRKTHKTPFILKHGIPKHAPNEKRFEIIKHPHQQIDKQQHRVTDWARVAERKTLLASAKETYYSKANQLDAKYEIVHANNDGVYVDFERQVARDETYFNKARERVDGAPKTNIDIVKAHNSVAPTPQVLLVDFERQLPRDNLIYNISTHMNLKETEKIIRKQLGKHRVFGSGVVTPVVAEHPSPVKIQELINRAEQNQLRAKRQVEGVVHNNLVSPTSSASNARNNQNALITEQPRTINVVDEAMLVSSSNSVSDIPIQPPQQPQYRCKSQATSKRFKRGISPAPRSSYYNYDLSTSGGGETTHSKQRVATSFNMRELDRLMARSLNHNIELPQYEMDMASRVTSSPKKHRSHRIAQGQLLSDYFFQQ
ncbi:hypothetical protein FGO68_gene16380 [Halteria grandinella]|uniref:Uncharacterized protein n=1 Tax=Halteria grandinella TaxID=5974 RepID=A0A8J8T5L7_HALGN|nr:hypothetical protein FGO68_gene16380 [Halteria grandinella]